MPDTPQNPEQTTDQQSADEQSVAKIADLPMKTVGERDAEAVKGGVSGIHFKDAAPSGKPE